MASVFSTCVLLSLSNDCGQKLGSNDCGVFVCQWARKHAGGQRLGLVFGEEDYMADATSLRTTMLAELMAGKLL